MSNTELANRFWNNVNRTRLNQDMSWDTLGRMMGTTAQSLVTMKNAHRNPSIAYALAIADVLEASLDDLCRKDGEDMEDNTKDSSIQDVLSAVGKKLTDDEALVLVLVAQQMIKVRKADSVEMASDPGAQYTADGSSALIERLKKRYL